MKYESFSCAGIFNYLKGKADLQNKNNLLFFPNRRLYWNLQWASMPWERFSSLRPSLHRETHNESIYRKLGFSMDKKNWNKHKYIIISEAPKNAQSKLYILGNTKHEQRNYEMYYGNSAPPWRINILVCLHQASLTICVNTVYCSSWIIHSKIFSRI